MTVLEFVGNVVEHIRVAQYQQRQIDREFAEQHAQDHLDRLRAGIKDNVNGLNGH
jgi:hypothetical protein